MQKFKEELHVPKWLNFKPSRMVEENYMGHKMLQWPLEKKWAKVTSNLVNNF